MSDSKFSRRDFMKVTGAGTAGFVMGGKAQDLGASQLEGDNSAPPMPERPLGKTGHNVRLFSLGGQATIEQQGTDAESDAIINRAIDLGVNYIDTAAAYGRGISQVYVGRVMATRRDEVFLATKTHDRTRDGSFGLLEESLKSLQTDRLDLWQMHNVRSMEDLDRRFGDDGSIHALREAKEQGIVKHVGITGHADPDVLVEGLKRFDFDTILLALNPADKYHRPFMDNLLPLANEKGMGVIAMKIPARGRIFQEGGLTSMREALTWTFSQPISTVIVGCDNVAQLEENISAAVDFQPMNSAQMAAVEEKVAGYPQDASFFKTGAAGFNMPDGQEDDQQMDG
ncbi:MAG: aldo/keto reductase [Gemmatimonadetes bacterium]|nr:aldo/keto reductase [Gemmatimonadota bacterium]